MMAALEEMAMDLDFDVLVPKFDAVLSRGLSSGLGKQGSQVCIEAAWCEVLGLKHGDDPKCVAADVRSFKITLNDSEWSSPTARAVGLRDLGIAQLGTKGMAGFSKRMAKKTIRVLIPHLFRAVLKDDLRCMAAADRCEREGTLKAVRGAAGVAAYADAAYAAAHAAAHDAAYAAYAAAAADDDASYAAAHDAAYAAAYAANAANAAANARPDFYLMLSARLALEALREMGSPGAKWLDAHQ